MQGSGAGAGVDSGSAGAGAGATAAAVVCGMVGLGAWGVCRRAAARAALPRMPPPCSNGSAADGGDGDDNHVFPPLVVSAPGKVLVTGGYLILEKPRQGLVVSTTARFYTSVQWRRRHSGSHRTATDTDQDLLCRVLVRSPQFRSTVCYEVRQPPINDGCSTGLVPNPILCVAAVPYLDHAGRVVPPPSRRNPYVHTTLTYVLTALTHSAVPVAFSSSGDAAKDVLCARTSQGYHLEIILNADNCFYSQQGEFARRGLPVSQSSSYAALGRFTTPPTTVSKTGLGSSATLVTSLVGALVAYVGGAALPTQHARQTHDTYGNDDLGSLGLVHRLAQLCHVVAQGKVGSGFDVCAAVYGSICYERYSPSLLRRFIGTGEAPPTADDIMRVVVADKCSGVDDDGAAVAGDWDHTALPFGLPGGMEMVLGDIAQGSSTPSMVRSVLKWKKADQSAADAAALWHKLDSANKAVKATLAQIRSGAGGDTATTAGTTKLASQFVTVRHLLKRMGHGAGVDIEPDAQTALCDATMQLDGVFMCGVPGAGGNDAVFAIYEGGDATRARIEAFWSTWRQQHGMAICSMPLRGIPHGEPGVRVEDAGEGNNNSNNGASRE